MAAAERQAGAAALFLAPALLAISVMLLVPLALILRFSVNQYDLTELMIETVTPANYQRFVADPFYVGVLRTTLGIAVLCTALCLLLGLPIAYRLARMTSRWKTWCMLGIVMPLFVGNVVRMVGWIILFARNGMVDSTLRWATGHGGELMYTPFAVVAGIVSVNLPVVILTVQSTIETIDPRIEEAAQSLGAPPGRSFWRVVWPLALPGTVTAAILCFILAMNAYATPYLLGGPRFQMMAPLVYWEFATNNNWPFASAMALILMATTLGLTAVGNGADPSALPGLRPGRCPGPAKGRRPLGPIQESFMAFLSTAVREYRHGAMQALMDREGLDALAFTTADFFQFATNFSTDVQTWERPIVCVVPRDGAPFAVLNELSTNHWRYAAEDGRLWVSDTLFYAEHPSRAGRLPLRPQWAEIVADRLRTAGLAGARIGTDSAGGMLAQAVALLPGAALRPMVAGMQTLRWVKCPEELALMREIASLTDWVQGRYAEAIRPGRGVQEMDMTMAAACAEEAGRRFPGEHLESGVR